MSLNIGQLYIVSAPSGAGKSSLLQALRQKLGGIAISVSHTTRAPRPGEMDGQHYHFVSADTFKHKIATHDFLEHAQVFDNFYGTSQSAIEVQLQQGLDVILEIDWQGARQVRDRIPGTLSIFILPPNLNALEQRLRHRQQDNEATIQRRMRDAQTEMSHYPEYDYLLINDEFEIAVRELASIFQANRLRLMSQMQHQAKLLDKLISA